MSDDPGRREAEGITAGEIVIAIESGAHFEGSVQRQEDPLASGAPRIAVAPAAAAGN